MSNVTQFPGAYTYTLEANPGVARAVGFVRKPAPVLPFVMPTAEPAVRPDVVDATLDAYLIQRLLRNYGARKRDIANTFGLGSSLGKCAPIWSRTALIATMHSKWSAL